MKVKIDSVRCLSWWSGILTASVAGTAFGGGGFPVCDDAAGECREVHPDPGCNIPICCEEVCAFEAFCCDVTWDQFCVDYAKTLFNCEPPPPDAIYDNGPVVTHPGAGAGGADVSAISPGSSLYGGNFNRPSFRRADDFVVGAGGWQITGLEFFGYQTGSTTESSFTGAFVQIWDGVPGEGGQVIWGDTTTNVLSGSAWSGIYRTSATAFDATNRPIMRLAVNDLNIKLAEGIYWVEFGATGSLASGPWVPPLSGPDEAPAGNSRLYTAATDTWSTPTDGGTLLPYDLPFRIYGTGSSSPCVSSVEPCTVAHGTPGCANSACCGNVCGVFPDCCVVAWDDLCVEAASELCGLYVCPDGDYPGNNCPTGAILVVSDSSVAFDSTGATTTGPLQPQCGSGEGDNQIWNDLWYRIDVTEIGRVTASTCDAANFDTKIAAYDIGDGTFDPNALQPLFVACNEDGEGCLDGTSRLSFIAQAETSYLIRLGGYQGGSGTGVISFSFEPAIPPQVCKNPGANPIATSPDSSVATGGIACAGGGVTRANSYAKVFPQTQTGAAYSFDCVNFGLDNSGPYIEGTIGVWIDPSGGVPSVSELVPLASYPVGLYTGNDQYLTVTGETVCVELTGDETLVVTLDIPAQSSGFTTFAGGATSDGPTYYRSDACGQADFIALADIGFPNNHWYVEVSGNIGCDDPGIPGDLNNDGIVNGADLSIMLSAWGTADPVADLDGSGNVDGGDLAILLSNWTA